MSLQLCTEWRLVQGVIVEVRLGSSPYRVGLVEDVMPDGSGIWLAADGIQSREFLEKAQGYSLWTTLVYYQPGVRHPLEASASTRKPGGIRA